MVLERPGRRQAGDRGPDHRIRPRRGAWRPRAAIVLGVLLQIRTTRRRRVDQPRGGSRVRTENPWAEPVDRAGTGGGFEFRFEGGAGLGLYGELLPDGLDVGKRRQAGFVAETLNLVGRCRARELETIVPAFAGIAQVGIDIGAVAHVAGAVGLG